MLALIVLIVFIIVAVSMTAVMVGIVHDRANDKIINQSYAKEILLNYYTIARNERAIWGQTFHTSFPATDRSCACDTCTKTYGLPPMYSNNDLVRPSRPVNEDWRDRDGE